MTESYFENIENVIINEIMLARKSIRIAVAWFTLKSILDILIRKVRGGVNVEIILHYDDVNKGGHSSLDFSEFIRYGGTLIWAHKQQATMHEKFCIIDDSCVIEGTYNWTNRAENQNDEHICVHSDDPVFVSKFVERYQELKIKYTNVTAPTRQPISRSVSRLIAKNKTERLMDFCSELDNYCIPGLYTQEYISSFKKYWTADVSKNKMRFENDSLFVMYIELQRWGDKLESLTKEREQKEKEELRIKEIRALETYFTPEAYKAFEEYSKLPSSIPQISSYQNQLDEIYEALNPILPSLKDVYMKDYFREKKNVKMSVFDYLRLNHLPAIVIVNNSLGKNRNTIAYSKNGNRVVIPLKYVERLQACLRIPLIIKVEKSFDTTLKEKAYVERYIRSKLYELGKIGNYYNPEAVIIDKEKLHFICEAHYAFIHYENEMNRMIHLYGNVKLSELYEKTGLQLPNNIEDIELAKIPLTNVQPFYVTMGDGCIEVEYHSQQYTRLNEHHKVINKFFDTQIQGMKGFWSFRKWFYLPSDLIYERHGIEFASIEELCGYNIDNKTFHPLQYYCDVISTWKSSNCFTPKH